jgi:hypothetical protein
MSLSRGFSSALRGVGGRVMSGLTTCFNIYISNVKKIQNEERGISPRFFFEFFFVVMRFRSKQRKNGLMITTELKTGPLYT